MISPLHASKSFFLESFQSGVAKLDTAGFIGGFKKHVGIWFICRKIIRMAKKLRVPTDISKHILQRCLNLVERSWKFGNEHRIINLSEDVYPKALTINQLWVTLNIFILFFSLAGVIFMFEYSVCEIVKYILH